MSTHSAIGILHRDGVVEGIYCHYDGGPRYVGKLLLNHYMDPEKVGALVEGGNLSSLGAEIGTKHDFNDRPLNECTFYGRDRGEKDQDLEAFDCVDDFREHFNGSSYYYVFDWERETWLWAPYGQELRELTDGDVK